MCFRSTYFAGHVFGVFLDVACFCLRSLGFLLFVLFMLFSFSLFCCCAQCAFVSTQFAFGGTQCAFGGNQCTINCLLHT